MSWQMDATRALVWMARAEARKRSASPDQPRLMDPNRSPAPIPESLYRDALVTSSTVGGTAVWTLTPRRGTPTATVLYTAGGTYSSPIGSMHWGLIQRLVRASRARFVVPMTLLAPEHTLDDALPDLMSLYRAERDHSTRLVLAGDSSGGGLALAMALSAKASGMSRADALILFSPWVDVTLTDPKSRRMEPHDPVMRMAGPRAMGKVWAGSRPVTDPLVSPVYGDLTDLPPMGVWHGGHDLSLPDVEKFVGRARQDGVPVHYVMEPAGIHVYPMLWWTPEARRAVDQAARIIRNDEPVPGRPEFRSSSARPRPVLAANAATPS